MKTYIDSNHFLLYDNTILQNSNSHSTCYFLIKKTIYFNISYKPFQIDF